MIYPYREVANHFKCSVSTVHYAVQQQRDNGSNRAATKPGRPKKASARDLAHIRRVIVTHRRLSLVQLLPVLKDLNLPLSLSSLKRVFRRLGLMRYVAQFKPFLTRKAKRQRHKYALKHLRDDLSTWRRTIFVDEAAIRVDGRFKTYVSRAKGQGMLADCLMPRLQSMKGSCMVWAAIWHDGRSDLVRFDQSESEGQKGGVTAKIYRDQITKGALKKVWSQVGRYWRGYGQPQIVEDGSRVHTSALNRAAGKQQHFKYLQHPPYSPDLNPIENCWAMLKRQLAQVSPRPTTTDKLFEAAAAIWSNIPQANINATVDSMPWRVTQVWRTQGGSLNCCKCTLSSGIQVADNQNELHTKFQSLMYHNACVMEDML